jgi:hypothetical protein
MLTTWHPLIPKKLALTSLTGGGHSVSIVRLRTEAKRLLLFFFYCVLILITSPHVEMLERKHGSADWAVAV